jgi:hypothetical protein
MSLLRFGNSGIPLFFAPGGLHSVKVKTLLLFAAGCGCRCRPCDKFTPRRRMHARCSLSPRLLLVVAAPGNVVFGSSNLCRCWCLMVLLLRCRHFPPAGGMW